MPHPPCFNAQVLTRKLREVKCVDALSREKRSQKVLDFNFTQLRFHDVDQAINSATQTDILAIEDCPIDNSSIFSPFLSSTLTTLCFFNYSVAQI